MAPFTLEECKCAYISQPCFIGTSNAAGKRWPSGTPQCPPVQASHSLISAPTIRAKETTKGAVRNHLSGLCSLPPSAALSLLSPCPQEALALRGTLVFAFLLHTKWGPQWKWGLKSMISELREDCHTGRPIQPTGYPGKRWISHPLQENVWRASCHKLLWECQLLFS